MPLNIELDLKYMLHYIKKNFHPLWHLRKFAWFRYLQKRLDWPFLIKSHNIRVWIMLLRDISLALPTNDIEVATHRVLENIILSFNITHIFDIGANVGLYTWHALHVKPSLEAYLFEPDPTNIRLLKKTISTNQFHRVHLWEGVVSNRSETVDFFVDESSGAGGSIRDHSHNLTSLHVAYGMSKQIKVKSTSLDAYIEKLSGSGQIVVKVDVEGAEREVFEGGMAFIRKLRPIIFVECTEEQNLIPLYDIEYVFYPLNENYNYLLLPKELERICKDKQLL